MSSREQVSSSDRTSIHMVAIVGAPEGCLVVSGGGGTTCSRRQGVSRGREQAGFRTGRVSKGVPTPLDPGCPLRE